MAARPPSHISDALARLDALTRRLRAECPWDREQDERSIVPHTVEEAYELADAANAGDDAKLLDELGDVLFQVHFLSLLLEERGAGDLGAVAEHCRRKLIRRHPHVFGDVDRDGKPDADQPHQNAGPDAPRSITSGEVLRNWDQIKAREAGREPGTFGDVPENLPALLYARKLQRRAAAAGLLERASGATGDGAGGGETFDEIGERLFALVDEARRLRVDPELALRAAAQRFRARLHMQGDR
ncbi:MAG TPA: MazG nucleotide pyrophosphohydrolase domain-containing protein [Solirubrobacteraceae bacterium]|nr:MazG nucleotide pyrophosphohydrolase domain-containing protein [Solirubrobacteraceae bacterium]